MVRFDVYAPDAALVSILKILVARETDGPDQLRSHESAQDEAVRIGRFQAPADGLEVRFPMFLGRGSECQRLLLQRLQSDMPESFRVSFVEDANIESHLRSHLRPV